MSLTFPAQAPEIDEEAPYETANLRPRRTGLPMTVYVSFRGKAKHDARLKVSTVHGDMIDLDRVAVVAIRPAPRLVHGELDRSDFDSVARWINLNREVLIDHWEQRIDTGDLLEAIQKL